MFVTPGYAQETAPAEAETHDAASGDHAAETGAHTEQAEGGSFPPFDPQYFPSQILWLVITFGLLYLFLQKVVLPRLAVILDVRRERIAQDLDKAAAMKSEADAAIAAYEQELAEAKSRANAIGQEARDSAKTEAETQRKEIERGLDGKLADAEARISKIKSSAMQEVGSIAEDTAQAIVQQLLGGTVDRKTVAAAVREARG